MRRRAGSAAVALSIVAALTAGCAATPSGRASGPRKPTSTTTTGRSATTLPAQPAWSRAIPVAPGGALVTVSCPQPFACLAGSATGQTYRLAFNRVTALGAAVPSPAPQGSSYLSCASTTYCAAAPSLNQVATFDGSAWAAPTTVAGAQGFTAIDCTGPTFCITVDGEGNSFVYDGSGWSGNVGAWGAANQISCVSPQFCVAAEGGPSVWNGSTWSQPNDDDAAGQLNSVSCATSAFCVLVDTSGNVITWNGQSFSPPTAIVSEPPQTGENASGLTGVSCPTVVFCRAVDSLGRVFAFDGTSWSKGTLVDDGHAFTAVSCSTTAFCVAVDRSGNAFVWG